MNYRLWKLSLRLRNTYSCFQRMIKALQRGIWQDNKAISSVTHTTHPHGILPISFDANIKPFSVTTFLLEVHTVPTLKIALNKNQ